MSQNLVPPAERPAYQPTDYIETSQDTIWYNPFEYDVAVQVHVGAEGKAGPTPAEEVRWKSLPAPVRREKQTGVRTYVIKAKSERAIPSDFDMAIQHTQCSHYECLGSKGLYCKNPDHSEHKTIVAGLYPRLVNKGTQRTPIREPAKLHWALDDQKAKAAQALEDSKRRLSEAQNARDAFLIAQADLSEAQAEIARAEARIGSPDANPHKDVIANAGGGAKQEQTPPAQQSSGKKDK